MSLNKYKSLILFLFTKKYYSANMIAIHLTNSGYPVSRQGIIQALQSWGYDTSKSSAGWVNNTCPTCKRVFAIKRAEMRRILEDGKTGKQCPFGGHIGKEGK